MKIKNINNKINGFTLVEVIIYVAIFSIFVGSLASFSNLINSSRTNNQITLEVNNQGNQAVRVITQSIRNATAINSPTVGTNSSSLSINTTTPSKNPTVFSVSGGILYITEGVSAQVALTNNKVSVQNLSFNNLSKPSTSGSIQIRFTLNNAILNSSSINRSVDFYGSATIKK